VIAEGGKEREKDENQRPQEKSKEMDVGLPTPVKTK